MRGKKGHLIAGLVLLTVGCLFILDRLFILQIYTSWPLILVAVGVALFLLNPHSLASRIVGGIGVLLFLIYFVTAFFPEAEAWSDLVWPSILVIIGIFFLCRYYQAPAPKPPAQPPPPEPPKGSPDS